MPGNDLPEWVYQHRREVGTRLRTIRLGRRLTQEQLAERVGVDSKTVSRAENGVHTITIDLVARFARALDVPSWRLFKDG